MTDKEKLKEIKKLADSMYYAAQYLTTDASRLHKAMDEYHKFIVHECKEEPVSEPQVKESLISIHDDKTCKENGNSLTQEPTIPDIVDEHFYEMLGLEPVSNPIDFEQELYKAFGQVKDFTLGMQIAKWFYDMGRNYQEPVSEELEKAAKEWLRPQLDKSYANYGEVKMMELTHFDGYAMLDAIEFGAKWQKEHLWKPADGDDLPEYDREVIAILDYDFGHYKVVYAHRPNPNGWNGTNIDTGEKEHFEPVIYDKGGWNQPHALYWLDAKLPYEENKIIKEL